VAATTQDDARLWISPGIASNYGKCVDIWAPGADVISASRRSDSATEYRSGTSQAVPFVAGAGALYLQNSSGAHAPVQAGLHVNASPLSASFCAVNRAGSQTQNSCSVFMALRHLETQQEAHDIETFALTPRLLCVAWQTPPLTRSSA
jgi:hypothetical protein